MGETIKKSLIELGVFSISDLVRITPVKAYQNICKLNHDKAIGHNLIHCAICLPQLAIDF